MSDKDKNIRIIVCPKCKGKGYLDSELWTRIFVAQGCDKCDGQGLLLERKTVTVEPYYGQGE